MCKEIFEIVKTLNMSQAEIRIALQCAPVIMGIKVSNLLIVSMSKEKDVYTILKKTGFVSYRLLQQDEKTIFLIFHLSKFETYLQDFNVQKELILNDYSDLSIGGVLREFRQRYRTYMNKDGDFPHEIGILLGYPIEDVRGFIQHKGKNYLYSGYWKVYQDVEEKRQLFDAYKSAKEALIMLVANGYNLRSIIELLQDKRNVF